MGNREQVLDKLRVLALELRENYSASTEEILDIVKESEEKRIPISIFNNKTSSLETVSYYLKEKKKLKIIEIASILNRDSSVISRSISSARKKLTDEMIINPSKYDIPINIISNRELSILESIVYYLKNTFNLRFSEIGRMLNRSAKTIWTVHSRALKKQEGGRKE